MRLSLPVASRLRTLFGLTVWGGSIAGAWWLYQAGGAGGGTAVAIAQAKEHRVSSTQLGRLTSLEVVEGQRVSSGDVIARFETGLISDREVRGLPQEGSVLRAGDDGYVSLIHAQPGDVIKAGDAVVTLVERQPSQAVAYLDERRGHALSQGTRVLVRRHGVKGEQWEAVVSAVAANVTELPHRLWRSPHVPSWGRAMYMRLPGDAAVEPGELLDVFVEGGSDPQVLVTGRLSSGRSTKAGGE